jgi:putative aldouronate transport system permease protein
MLMKTKSDIAIDFTNYFLITLFCVFCLIPLMIVISSSFTDELALLKNGFALWPSEFSTKAYETMFQTSRIFDAYKVTLFVVIVGTFLSMILTSAIAYAISVKTVKYRNHIAFFVFFTMLFSGGLVPTYLLIAKYLDMKDTIWVLIIPVLISPWNMFLLRNFFSSIPDSLAESAKMDGASEMTVLFRIILPVSMPAIATISLFYALGYWNEWFNAMLYISEEKLYPLQYLIMDILRNIDFMNELAGKFGVSNAYTPPTYTARMATTVLTIGPIVFIYPFVQKYFVKGMMVGSVKG